MAKTAAALHILVKEEKLALDLLEQLKNGADFGKLAKKHSICPSGKRGGDLGEFRQGQMVPPSIKWSSPARNWSQPARCIPSSATTSSKCYTGNKQQGLLKEKAFNVCPLSHRERVGVRASARTFCFISRLPRYVSYQSYNRAVSYLPAR